MKRRSFLFKFNLGFLFIILSRVFNIGIISKPFTIKIRGQSNIFPNRVYTNIKSFWKDHPEKEPGVINQLFRKKKLLLGSDFYLESQGRSVIVEKTFSNKRAYNLYNEILEKNFSNRKKTILYNKV